MRIEQPAESTGVGFQRPPSRGDANGRRPAVTLRLTTSAATSVSRTLWSRAYRRRTSNARSSPMS